MAGDDEGTRVLPGCWHGLVLGSRAGCTVQRVKIHDLSYTCYTFSSSEFIFSSSLIYHVHVVLTEAKPGSQTLDVGVT